MVDTFKPVTQNEAKEFAEAVDSHNGLDIGRIMDEVGPCGWSDVFNKARGVFVSGERPVRAAYLTVAAEGDTQRVSILQLESHASGFGNSSAAGVTVVELATRRGVCKKK